jgi:hypothetical protein
MTTELSNFATRLRAHIAEANFETSNDLFPRLALELFRLQFAANSAYRRICEARGATPATISDWTAIPSVPTAAFKEFELSCLPAAERTHVFHSSGTTGQRPSRHFHNAESLATYEESLWPWFAANVLSAGDSTIGDRKLVLLTPSPAAAPNSSLVHMFDTVRRKLGASQGEYCAKIGAAGAWELDFELTTSRLRAFNSDNKPRLVLGTAFSFVHLLDHLAAAGLQFSLPAGSRVMETGGYKGRSREISKADLHQLITRHLGIPPSHRLRIRDERTWFPSL